MNLNIPYMETDNKLLNDAYRIAAGDIVGNIVYYQNGLLTEEKPCMIAGLDYNTPWTRDTAINVWNALSILSPEVSKNTLLAVLEEEEGNIYIGGQYWDSIIWMIGAREYCRFHKTITSIALLLKPAEILYIVWKRTNLMKRTVCSAVPLCTATALRHIRTSTANARIRVPESWNGWIIRVIRIIPRATAFR